MRAVAFAVAGLVFAAASVQAQSTEKTPTCRADQRGQDLVTRIEYPDGYTVEGPWHVTGRAPAAQHGAVITAVLDRIVETQAASHQKQTTSLPSAIEMTFHGTTVNDLLVQAANIWCMTVMQARPPWAPDIKPSEAAGQLRITP